MLTKASGKVLLTLTLVIRQCKKVSYIIRVTRLWITKTSNWDRYSNNCFNVFKVEVSGVEHNLKSFAVPSISLVFPIFIQTAVSYNNLHMMHFYIMYFLSAWQLYQIFWFKDSIFPQHKRIVYIFKNTNKNTSMQNSKWS